MRKRLSVVIADDEQISLSYLKKLLLELECDVLFEAKDGIQLLGWLKTNEKPDAIFMDLVMPGGAGTEEILKNKMNYPPIVIVSALTDAAEKIHYLIADFVVKPYSKDILSSTINRLYKHIEELKDPKANLVVRCNNTYNSLLLKYVSHFELKNNIFWAYVSGHKFETVWESLQETESRINEMGLVQLSPQFLSDPKPSKGFHYPGTVK